MSVILKLSEKEIKLLTEALAIRACSLLNQNYAAKFHKLKKKIHKQHAELPKIMIHSVIMNSESGISVDNYLTEESMIEGLNELRAGVDDDEILFEQTGMVLETQSHRLYL